MKTQTTGKQSAKKPAPTMAQVLAQDAAKRAAIVADKANSAAMQQSAAQAPATVAQASATKPAGKQKAPADTKVSKKAGRTLYAFVMGNGDGVSMFGRMVYFAIYAAQIGGQPLKGIFPSGKPFRMYQGFNSGYWIGKGIMQSEGKGRVSFTSKGTAMLTEYPIEDSKTYAAIAQAVKTGKPKGTGRDNQKMYPFSAV